MDDSRMDEIFAFIEGANVDLDYDPIGRGPKFLNTMVATTRNLTNKIQKFEREVSRQELLYERQLNKLESEYELKLNDLLANDEDVARLSSAGDRKAKAEDILQDLKKEIMECKSDLTDLGHVGSVIDSKLREMRDVNRSLNTQIRLVEDEIKIGNWWGDQGEDNNQIKDEDVDLDGMLPENSGSSKDEVGDEEYKSLFGESEDDSPEGTEDFDEVLNSIDPNTNNKVITDEDQPIDVDDLLSGF